MIRASAMFSTHTMQVLHRWFRDTLIILVFIFAALFVWLKVGISTDTLYLGKYKVEGLYIKLDKKLTLRADKVEIPRSKSKPSFENVDETFDKIKYLLTFFEYIDVQNVTFSDNHINVFFADETLYITSDDYEIAGNIHREKEKLVAEVSLLYIKKDAINIKGELTYDLKTHVLATQGDFDAYHITGTFTAKKTGDNIDFQVQSDTFTDLRTVIDTFDLKASVKAWIVDRVLAERYTLRSLSGRGYITKEGFKMDFDALKGEVLFEDVEIFFQKELDPVRADSFVLTYADHALHFDLKNPKYQERDMNGSTIAITGLGKEETVLTLHLKMHTILDKELHKILRSYDIDLPLKHTGEAMDVTLKMDIPLNDSNDTTKSSVFVNVDMQNGKVWYKNIKLPVSKANIQYDNTKQNPITVDATLKKGTVDIEKTSLPVLGGKVSYHKKTVQLDNVHLKEDWYEGRVKGKVDLTRKKADLRLDAKQISIGDKKKFLVLKNKKFPLTLDYSKNTRVDIPSLGLKVSNQKEGIRIQAEKLDKIKPYLQNLGIEMEGGKLDILQKGSGHYTFKGILRRNACFFYEKNGQCLTRVPCSGTVKNGNLDFYAFNKRLYYNSKKSRLTVKNLNIDLKKVLSVHQKRSKAKGKSKKKAKSLVILGKNSKIRYDKYTLVTDSYDIEIKPNSNIQAFASLDGDIVKFSKKGNNFSVKALRVKDKMLHPLIQFKGLKHGRYTLKISGNPDKTLKGQIIIEGGMMKDFKAYNNTLAFINTIPALATLSRPGFSEKGFKIIEGVAEYRMTKNKVIFDSIYIKGSSATLIGKGSIDLKTKGMQMDLAIQTARELGKVVGNLPLLGYILMGKDKSVTVGLKITGTIDKPVVKTSAVGDILTIPLKLIKRTLESPAYIINQ